MLLELLLFIVTLIASIYAFFKHKFNYWKDLGVPYIQPRIPFGNIQGFKRKLHSSQIFPKFYAELKAQSQVGFGGIYFFTSPVVFPTDLKFIKNIFVKDFQYFHDRGFYYNEKDDPLSAHLLALEGDKWKFLREKLTPTFTSGKLKLMFPNILEVAIRLNEVVEKLIDDNQEIEMKALLARFTTDIIGSCAFGIDCNCLHNQDAEFSKMGMKAFLPRNSPITQVIGLTFPNFAKKLRIKTTRDDVSDFFLKVVADVVKYREENSVQRNDFMSLLLQLKNTGSLDGKSEEQKLTFEQIAAEAFVFFLAGFETSSTTMTFCLHELSLHQDIQEKARRNVLEVMEKFGGEITYEALNEMTYLEQCING
jgi:cytochrome P450 family 6